MSVHLNKIFTIPGYRILEKIYADSKTLVCRGIRESDQKLVIIKLMHSKYPSFTQIAQFRNQYAIAMNLQISGIVQTYSLENCDNSYALVMEDFGGVSLRDYLDRVKKSTTIPLQEFFQIAVQIASTLDELHRHYVIHKDIKPANILINPTTFEVKLADFSIASLLPKEIQYLTNPNFLEGTLAYISPEQTGRMNRGIDYRSDFYSLGVTFFELLTGQLPFTTKDPIELIYSHIAKQQQNPSEINCQLPKVVSDIIGKLMAKNSEDRYQSGFGLKCDLEICWQQWQTIGNIIPFQLGQHDISDRFIIPEKLYDRQQEVKTLLAAFERVSAGTTEMVLITGASGIGKTAVVNEVHKPILRQRGYFIKGKFDRFKRDIPLSALVQAFEDLIRQILSEADSVLQQWKTGILAGLGTQARVLTNVIPSLELIIGPQPPVAELSGIASQNRFNLLFQRFIKLFGTEEHPLVIFLDDLQWADTASLKLIELLMSSKTTVTTYPSVIERHDKESSIAEDVNIYHNYYNNLLLMGAYRDNEVSPTHPLFLTIKAIEKSQATLSCIQLQSLSLFDLNSLISDTLHCEKSVSLNLTEIVFAKTQGNPFFCYQFLKNLHTEGAIEFNFNARYWQYDIAKVKALTFTENVVEFMALQIEKLPRKTQDVLKLAACIGNQFDLKTLAIVHQKSEADTADNLWTALLEGLIIQDSEKSKLSKYKFIHDRVQQAAYSLISKSQKKKIHLKIGQLLLSRIPIEERKEKIFELVNQLNIAAELIGDRKTRYELIDMNLIAGTKAMLATAYTAAVKYFKTGIDLLTADCWEADYNLSLTLYEKAVEAAYLDGHFEQMQEIADVVLKKAKTLLDTVKVYEVIIQARGSQNKLIEAISIALSFLKLLGTEFPENPNQTDVQNELERTASNLASFSIDTLSHLPKMKEVLPLAVMCILSSVTSLVYPVNPQLFLLIILKQVNLSIKYGNAPSSAFAYATYGLTLCGVVEDIESGYQFGKLGKLLLSGEKTSSVTAKVLEVFNHLIKPWKEHISETLQPLLDTYSIALETGDLEFAAYALYGYSYSAYFTGQDLTELEQQIAIYSSNLQKIKQHRVFYWNEIYRQTVLNLCQAHKEHHCLIGEAYDEEKMLPIHLETNDGVGLLFLYLCKLQLCYLFGDYSRSIEYAAKAEEYLYAGTAMIILPIFNFYHSLSLLARYPSVQLSEQEQIWGMVIANQEKMQKWACHAPMNFLHKFYLVKAEQHRIRQEYAEAVDSYEYAITYAQQNQYINEEALANELAAKFYLEWNKLKIAKIYLTDAYFGYVRWGAKAKADNLTNLYPQFFTSVLQQEEIQIEFSKNTSNSFISVSTSSTNQTFSGANTSISNSLDLIAVIKASIALSKEIELEQLLSTLIQVVMENAGASKCALILNEGENLCLAVTAVTSNSACVPPYTKFPSIRLTSSQYVPITVINYVKRTQEILVIDDINEQPLFAADSYIIHEQPKSLLCIPIINQNKLLGILYLENNLIIAAFSQNRLELLKLITTQAAISLENAILYQNLEQASDRLEQYNHTLEEKVAERTQALHDKNQQLQQAIQELKQTQAQLIQSEKMSSLGQMVAGIAHEINNPVNFIHGNIIHANTYMHQLLDLIEVYQLEFSNSSASLQNKLQEIDLDFLKEDLPKILHSMKIGTTRIQNIVLELRNFSRLDEAEMKPVDIHEGINSTLMILHHRLKAKVERPEIKVIKEYGNLPQVECYVNQLNQVFMNILVNAIDALELGTGESKLGYGKITAPTLNFQSLIPTILIRTLLVENHSVEIVIADNGSGMAQEVIQKIFDPFFTTKPIGSGTGLGLSISYHIVVEKHQGSLTCNSVLGQGTEFLIKIPVKQDKARDRIIRNS
ncbi:AAA family ATPase [Scytonema sp. UIC 10036]|uniref:trifunctional serine/threonine-protein kinase/ATP-binding protein/sensor histidine kinase n=1 Tax=Scytonema sp. UIC 10036 TaxID=2304196 RepID=UPI0012DA3A3C|nr:ATP-binding sensor histidine kinase [Scytonema sp. UIC 10036]MUG95726.1 AAA family ATPase [Scytonema sp. UIC 10036]